VVFTEEFFFGSNLFFSSDIGSSGEKMFQYANIVFFYHMVIGDV